MTRIELTPQPFPVFNELDRHGVLLSLPRIESERNAAYKQRLLDVFVNRASSTYRGLINGITRELGYSLTETLTIDYVLNPDGTLTYPESALVFQETKCYIYSNFTTGALVATLDRFELDEAYSLGTLVDLINDTGYFEAVLKDGINANQRAMTIFNQSTLVTVDSEEVSSQSTKVNLRHKNVVDSSFFLVSTNLKNRVASSTLVSRAGDYYLDLEQGILYTGSVAAPGSAMRYMYRNPTMTFLSSPVILHNLQSVDFKTKMFNQVAQDDGSYVNGAPTQLGADLVNGLLSVYPSTFGQ
jgi:hypothetical protein